MPVEIARPLTADNLARLRIDAEEEGSILPGLLVEAERVAATVSQGVHGRRRTGPGETFWQFRPYHPGDSATDIDWRQSARSRNLFVREQEWEAAESIWLWIDQSKSMSFRSQAHLPFKRDRAILLGLALGVLLIRGGERVTLLGSGLRPRGGKAGFDQLAERLLQPNIVDAGIPPQTELPRLARLVLISDFLQTIEGLDEVLSFYSGNETRGSLLRIVDPAERDMPFEGRAEFLGMEAEGSAIIGSVGEIRDRYRDLFQSHSQEVDHLAHRQGWTIGTHVTMSSTESALLTLYRMLAPSVAG